MGLQAFQTVAPKGWACEVMAGPAELNLLCGTDVLAFDWTLGGLVIAVESSLDDDHMDRVVALIGRQIEERTGERCDWSLITD